MRRGLHALLWRRGWARRGVSRKSPHPDCRYRLLFACTCNCCADLKRWYLECPAIPTNIFQQTFRNTSDKNPEIWTRPGAEVAVDALSSGAALLFLDARSPAFSYHSAQVELPSVFWDDFLATSVFANLLSNVLDMSQIWNFLQLSHLSCTLP